MGRRVGTRGTFQHRLGTDWEHTSAGSSRGGDAELAPGDLSPSPREGGGSPGCGMGTHDVCWAGPFFKGRIGY